MEQTAELLGIIKSGIACKPEKHLFLGTTRRTTIYVTNRRVSMKTGEIIAINISPRRGTQKRKFLKST